MVTPYEIAARAVEDFFNQTGEGESQALAFDDVKNKLAYDLAWDYWLECQPYSGIPDFSLIEEHVHSLLMKGV